MHLVAVNENDVKTSFTSKSDLKCRFHIVSVPVDFGVKFPWKPQDMAIQRWVAMDYYGNQNVIDLSQNFVPLPRIDITEADEDIVYCLVMESQWSKMKGMMDIRSHEIPELHQNLEMFFKHAFRR
ncbi:hypothetical protein BYT27DRAFT_7208659 [Phlegmacium glaucopus]|nr:hypothetical protein BYT27DRAFT_7208659 [Phlegmacium glaucopus]